VCRWPTCPATYPGLLSRFQAAGGELDYRRVTRSTRLADEAPVLVNCARAGRPDLVGDLSVVPVRRQIVRVSNPGLRMSVRDEDHPGGRLRASEGATTASWVAPWTRAFGTIGSTWPRAGHPRRCRELAPELARATVLDHNRGARPARPAVRLVA